MNQMTVEVEYIREEPDFKPLARYLLDQAFDFFKDPENERAFQEWKREREAATA